MTLAVLMVGLFGPLATAAEQPRPWPPDQFLPVTAERIASLPPGERSAWKAYWDASQALAAKLPPHARPEFSPLQPIAGPPRGGQHTKGLRLEAPVSWYSSEEAQKIADSVVAWQTGSGAWRKGIDYTKPLGERVGGADLWDNGTFDNDATVFELRFLALVQLAAPPSTRSAAWRASFRRGLSYCFAAQYPNGGIPQIYPLVGGYHDNITFNDSAMPHVLELFRDIVIERPEYGFVSPELRREAAERLKRGIACILATQIKGADGRLTAWDQQHDALTLEPAAARNFEPVAVCSSESAGIVELLMSLPDPSPGVVDAVDGAVAWFRRVAIHDLAWSTRANDGPAVVAPEARLLWARLYELGTDKPIFGDRDRTIHYAVDELSPERRAGYGWYGDWPARVIEAHAEWRSRARPSKDMPARR